MYIYPMGQPVTYNVHSINGSRCNIQCPFNQWVRLLVALYLLSEIGPTCLQNSPNVHMIHNKMVLFKWPNITVNVRSCMWLAIRDVAVIGISKIPRYKFVPVICIMGLWHLRGYHYPPVYRTTALPRQSPQAQWERWPVVSGWSLIHMM